MQDFSLLMSVYRNEKPTYLKQSLDSIFSQTILPNEIVVVKDGLLTKELENVLTNFAKKYNIFKFLEFKINRGLGLALRDGVIACSNELIARMDTDDIANKYRFEKQLNYLRDNQDITLLGTYIEEFKLNPNLPDSRTILPANHDEIVKFSKKRNPFRHMTVFFRKSAVLEVGNYRDFLWFEDYDLWTRLIKYGYKTANLPEILVSVRADDNMFARRGGWKYLKQDIRFQTYLLNIRYINLVQYMNNLFMRGCIRILPNNIRILFYKFFLRARK